jgi:hypothetical protein
MVSRLPPLRREFNESPQSDAWAAIRRGRARARVLCLGFIEFGKIKAMLIYFYRTATRVFDKFPVRGQQWWPK